MHPSSIPPPQRESGTAACRAELSLGGMPAAAWRGLHMAAIRLWPSVTPRCQPPDSHRGHRGMIGPSEPSLGCFVRGQAACSQTHAVLDAIELPLLASSQGCRANSAKHVIPGCISGFTYKLVDTEWWPLLRSRLSSYLGTLVNSGTSPPWCLTQAARYRPPGSTHYQTWPRSGLSRHP